MTAILVLADLALRFGRVNRATRHPDGQRPETDTDHTFMLALIALELVGYLEAQGIELGLDPGRLAMLALVHDLPESEAGDTNTMGGLSAEAKAAKAAREAAALERLRGLLGPSSWAVATIEAYERQDTPEARFLCYLDKVLVRLTHTLNGGITVIEAGHDLAWLEERHRAHEQELRARFPEWAELLGGLHEAAGRAAEAAFAARLGAA